MRYYIAPTVETPTIPELSEYLKSSISSFCALTKIPVTFYDTSGKILWECEPELKFCKFSDLYTSDDGICRKNLISSGMMAAQLGEPYICTCRLGLLNIAVSLIVDGKTLGCFMAGPLIMRTLRESTLATLLQISGITEKELPKIILFLRDMKVYEPKEVNHLALLLHSCVLASVGSNWDYKEKNRQYQNQLRFGNDLLRQKREKRELEYPFELEDEMIRKIKQGDTDGANEIIKELLSQISIMDAGDLPSLKARFFGIYAVLSRTLAENDPQVQETMELDYQSMHQLEQASSFDELVEVACSLIRFCSQNAIRYIYNGNSTLVLQALQYINQNFAQKLTLKNAAEYLHVNPSYLSMLFKQEMGMTFTDYLTLLRVDKAKLLLTETSLNMVDISLQIGFEDQSYFTKVFKKQEKCTPNEYRKTKK